MPLEPFGVPVTRRALVVGGGIAGIQASLDLANAGYRGHAGREASRRSAAT